MSDYTQITDFSVKDGYTTGNPEKIILGADFDGEFAAISTAIATKYDSADIASSAQATALTLDSVIMTPLQVKNVLLANAGMAYDLQQLVDPGADRVMMWDFSAASLIAATFGTGLTSNATAIELSHLGIEDLVDPNADRILMWDDSAGATAWMSAGTGLSISGTSISLSFLGLQSLTDPNDDRILFWDDSGGALAWLDIGAGLTLSGTSIKRSTQNATTTNPMVVSDGLGVEIDLATLSTMQGNGLAATDTFLVDNGGVPTGLEWQDCGFPVQTAQTSQTLAAADMNTIMEFDTTATLTIPANATTALPIGACVIIVNDNASTQVTVTAAASVVLNSIFHPGGATAASDNVLAGGTACLIKTATNEWYLSGNIAT